jgi:2-polyprenyl-3-methyl-5-hydroxy-6-metoxy-1,4-benzoquinol methylase
LILWAGGGAFDQRLVDSGYTNIMAVEFIPEAYKATWTTLISRDLNENFSDLGKFDCIIAMEIIEHLENPFSFMRNIKSCLSEKWLVLLSTPNVESFYSRFHFFFLNSLDYFGITELKGTGHISPIFHHIFSFFVENSGLRIIKRTYNQSAIHRWALFPNIVAIFAFVIATIFRIDTSAGGVNIYILAHK